MLALEGYWGLRPARDGSAKATPAPTLSSTVTASIVKRLDALERQVKLSPVSIATTVKFVDELQVGMEAKLEAILRLASRSTSSETNSSADASAQLQQLTREIDRLNSRMNNLTPEGPSRSGYTFTERYGDALNQITETNLSQYSYSGISIPDLSERIDKLESKIGSLAGSSSSGSSLSDISSSMSRLESRIRDLESKMSSMESKMSSLESKVR